MSRQKSGGPVAGTLPFRIYPDQRRAIEKRAVKMGFCYPSGRPKLGQYLNYLIDRDLKKS
jgi:hypothetical protein